MSHDSDGYKDSMGHFMTTGRFTSPVVKGKRQQAKSKALQNQILKGESKSKGKSRYSGKSYSH